MQHRLTLIALLALLVSGCPDDPSTGLAAIEGGYTLRAVNGGPLPQAIGDPSDKLRVTRGGISLEEDHTFREVLWISDNGGLSDDFWRSGTWKSPGRTVTLTYGGSLSATFTASYTTGVLTIAETHGGRTTVYEYAK